MLHMPAVAMPLAPCCTILMLLAFVDVFKPEVAQLFWQLSVWLLSMVWWSVTKETSWLAGM